MTERDRGKYWRGDGKRDVELLKEEEQVAVLDRVDKAQTSESLNTAEFVGNPTLASLCPNDPKEGQQNCREEESYIA